jgi:hypothetical protein
VPGNGGLHDGLVGLISKVGSRVGPADFSARLGAFCAGCSLAL